MIRAILEVKSMRDESSFFEGLVRMKIQNTEPGHKTETGHVVGETYESDYWGHTYTVLGEVPSRTIEGEMDVVVKKSNGEVKTHHTPKGRDKRIVTE